MRSDEWMKQYMGTFEPMDERLFALGHEYHNRCETYDRTICSGPVRDGGIMPMTSRELGLINRHALAISKEIIARGERMGFTKAQIQEAIARAA